jgi:polysaccharide pyruvyl transferase WcaK-like protein
MIKLAHNILRGMVLIEAIALNLLFPKKQRLTGRKVAVLEPCPTSNGSAGDEALISGVCRFARERKSTDAVYVVSFLPDYKGILPSGATYGGYLHENGNFLERMFSYLKWPFFIRKFDSFYIIGADLIDGYYFSPVSCFLFFLARLAAILKVDAHIVSASFNDNPPSDVKKSLAALPSTVRLHLRDKFSAERVKAIVKRPVYYSADVAFGLVPEETPTSQSMTNWIARQRNQRRQILVLNVNMLPIGKQYPGKEKQYLDQWHAWTLGMLGSQCSILFISHDYRGEWGDQIAAEKLYGQLTESMKGFCLLPDKNLHAAEIKDIVRKADLVVTGRMHLAIGALGSGIPVVGYAYQSKFEGIFDLFGQKNMVRSIDFVFNDIENEIRFCLDALKNKEEIGCIINQHHDKVMDLAGQNVTR